MTFNQIIYCSDATQNNPSLNYLQQKLNGVVRHYRDFLNLNYFDNNIVILDGYEGSDKYFKDIVSLNTDKCSFIALSDIDDLTIFNLIENTKRKSILGAGSFKGAKELEVKISESFSFNFVHAKKTLEKLSIQLHCQDRKHSFFQVSVFDADTTKCIFNKELRYMISHSMKQNDRQKPEHHLEVELDNPEFDAMGKKYTVTVKYLKAGSGGATCAVRWDNDYSPYKFLYRNTELFGSLNFFAY